VTKAFEKMKKHKAPGLSWVVIECCKLQGIGVEWLTRMMMMGEKVFYSGS